MTEAEKQEIVGLVMTQISSQAVDFDIATEQPQANDLLTAVRQTSSGAYVGVTLKWDDVARIATELANQAATRAEQAKQSIVVSEENVTTMASQVSSMKSEVYQMGVSVEAFKDQAETAAGTSVQKATEAGTSEGNAKTYMESAQSAQQGAESAKTAAQSAQGLAETAKLGAERARNTAEDYMKSAQQSAETSASNVERLENVDFRQKSPGKVILDVDVTGTMEGFIDGMEQEPYEAIALTLEPDVPTAESHNFGVRGQICIDSNYLYVCTALNTWKKISLLDL